MRREFFQLAIEECLSSALGMFYNEDESQLSWFQEQVCSSEK